MAKELVIRITGDQSGLRKATDDSIGTLKGFGSKVSALSVAAGNLLADGIKTGFTAAGGFLKDAIGAASDMQETISKVNVLFGDAADQISQFAATAALGLGQSRQQAMDAAATFATFGKSAGLTGAPLAKFSTDLVSLASDLASFSNTSPQDAIAAIGSALRGEAEPMRRYGVLLDEASLRQQAMSMGIISTTKDALTPQQKVLAAQALIFAQTSAAQGDFARTSDGLANQQRVLSATVADLKTRIGGALLPTVLKITSAINKQVLPALSAWAERYGPMVEAALSRLGGWISKVAGLFRDGGFTAAGGEMLKKLAGIYVALNVWAYGTLLPAVVRLLGRVGRAFGGWVVETAVPHLRRNLPIWMAALGDWMNGTALPWIAEQAAAFARLLGGWIVQASAYLAANLPGWIGEFAAWYYDTALPWIGERTAELAAKLGGWIGDAAAQLKTNLPGWIGEFVAWYYGTALPWMLSVTAELAAKLGGWIGDAAIALATNLPGWIAAFVRWSATEALPAMVRFGVAAAGAIKDGLLGSLDFMADIAWNLVRGLVDGLWGLAGYLADQIGGFVRQNVTGAIKSALGINSPSRIAAELGFSVAEGLMVGMRSGAGLLSGASDRLALATVSTGAGGFVPAQLPAGSGSWTSAPLVVQTFLDGRQIATGIAPYQRSVERAKR